jgi:hypothetical protein
MVTGYGGGTRFPVPPMKLPTLARWFLFLAIPMACDAASIRLSWTGTGPVGDTRSGLHSIILGEAGSHTYLALPQRAASVTVHNGTVYYAEPKDQSYSSWKVYSTDLQGGSYTPLYEINHSTTSWGFVVTGDYLYLSDSLNDTITRSNLDGSGLEMVFDSPTVAPSPAYMTATAGSLYWTQLAIDTRGRSQIWSLDHANPLQADSILTGLNEPRFLTASSNYLFWFDSVDRKIYRSDQEGGNLQAIVSSTWARGMVADEEHLYWTNNKNLMRSNHSGGNVEIVVTSDDNMAGGFLEVIPEPGCVLLAGFGGLVLLGRRRRPMEA